MPDTWEYPWYASWDLAFHCVALAHVDPDFAKDQLLLLCREWYMHPNGQLPAYEWDFGDVNPPVHAWAALRVFEIDGRTDFDFLERIFHKLLINFTWWVNRKDADGNNVFEGGFLGLDNIGPFDRSAALPVGGQPRAVRRHGVDGDVLPQPARDRPRRSPSTTRRTRTSPPSSSSTSPTSPTAMYRPGPVGRGRRLLLRRAPAGRRRAGAAAGALDGRAAAAVRHHQRSTAAALERLPEFAARCRWFVEQQAAVHRQRGPRRTQPRRRAAPPALDRRRPTGCAGSCAAMLDEHEFLSPYGLRSLSQRHRDDPFVLRIGGISATRRLRAGRVDQSASSAATPTGGARSGSRSTTC